MYSTDSSNVTSYDVTERTRPFVVRPAVTNTRALVFERVEFKNATDADVFNVGRRP